MFNQRNLNKLIIGVLIIISSMISIYGEKIDIQKRFRPFDKFLKEMTYKKYKDDQKAAKKIFIKQYDDLEKLFSELNEEYDNPKLFADEIYFLKNEQRRIKKHFSSISREKNFFSRFVHHIEPKLKEYNALKNSRQKGENFNYLRIRKDLQTILSKKEYAE